MLINDFPECPMQRIAVWKFPLWDEPKEALLWFKALLHSPAKTRPTPRDKLRTFLKTRGTLEPGNFFWSFSNNVVRGTPNMPVSAQRRRQ